MDIRTKLVLALVAVSLGSMLALGALTYGAARDLLQRSALRQLEAVAESKKEDLQKVIVAWRDRVQLITGQTELRESLRDLRRTRNPALAERIEQIVTDSLRSVRALRGISVHAADGSLVASTGLDPSGGERVRPVAFMWAEEPVVYENVTFDPAGGLLVAFVAPIRIEGSLVGAAKVLLSARELIDITDDYTGLGESGETLMAQRTEEGDAVILNPLRHDPGARPGRRIGSERANDPTLQAVLGHEGVYRQDAVDYRGEEVWAAARYLEEFDWGLVVKMDAREELRPIQELRSTMWRLAVSLSAFAIVAGTGLGLYFARPIRELADVARRIREGELDLRARSDAEDEVGLLARTFNEMTEELIRTNRELEARVRERAN